MNHPSVFDLYFKMKVLISRTGFSEAVSRLFTVWQCDIKKKSFSNTKALPEGADISNACVLVRLLFVHLRYATRDYRSRVYAVLYTCVCVQSRSRAFACDVNVMPSSGWNIYLLPCGWEVQYKPLCFLIGLSDFYKIQFDLNNGAG